MLVLDLFADARCADDAVVLAPLTRELAIALFDAVGVSIGAQRSKAGYVCLLITCMSF